MQSTIEERIAALHNLVKIQGSDGNWNYDSYMHGLFNGLELALATLEERDVNYKTAPDKWLIDIAAEHITASSKAEG